jgi:diacylglycerol kinase (ATP)
MPLILANPHAQGGRVGRLLPAIGAALDTLTPLARLHAPATVEQALDLLEHEPAGNRVVVIGGDGTLNRWLPALLSQRLTTGLVPLGSGNDMARALGLPRHDWRAALALALRGRARGIDTGLALWSDAGGDLHRTPFASSLTGGFDSSVGLRALHGPRWLRGRARYLWATLRELQALRHWQVTLQADGQPLHEGQVLLTSVLNTPSFGSGIPAVPRARVDDAQLDWLCAGPLSRLRTLQLLPSMLRGSHLAHPEVRTATLPALSLQCPEGLPLAADGEWLGLARQLRVQVVPASLQMVMPQMPR